MQKVIVTGASGFIGCNLVEVLGRHDYYVYAVAHPSSFHNRRLEGLPNVTKIECDITEYGSLQEHIPDSCDIFFHLAWQGRRQGFDRQYPNLDAALKALESARRIGCKRFIYAGSQSEYGWKKGRLTEETRTDPVDAYGAVKVAACMLTRERSRELGIEWISGRISSVYGKYEPDGQLIANLVKTLKTGGTFHMTDGTQMWDYLFAEDCAEALVALAEKGTAGEIYNIANGDVQPLREFTDEVQRLIGKGSIIYGGRDVPVLEMHPVVEKIQKDTGWKARTVFSDGVRMGFDLP